MQWAFAGELGCWKLREFTFQFVAVTDLHFIAFEAPVKKSTHQQSQNSKILDSKYSKSKNLARNKTVEPQLKAVQMGERTNEPSQTIQKLNDTGAGPVGSFGPTEMAEKCDPPIALKRQRDGAKDVLRFQFHVCV